MSFHPALLIPALTLGGDSNFFSLPPMPAVFPQIDGDLE
jgi:hypothetical protein